MPKSLTRGPARLLVLAVALGGPLAVVDSANASPADPVAPTGVTATATGVPGEARVSWTPSAQVDEEVVGYEISWVDQNGDADDFTVDGSEAQEQEIGYLADGDYSFSVQAIDSEAQLSDPISASSPVTIDGLSGPSELEAFQDGAGTLQVDWGAPTDAEFGDGAYELDHYRVELIEQSEDEMELVTPIVRDNVSPLTTSQEFSDLAVGEYSVYVFAVYEGGETPVERNDYTPADVAAGPDAPEVDDAEQSGTVDDEVEVYWSSQNRGFDVTGYRVELKDAEGVTKFSANVVGADKRQATVTGVASGEYGVVVTPVGAEGDFDSSMLFESVKVIESPAAVQGLTLTPNGPGSVRVSWQAPATGPAPTSYYVVWARTVRAEDGVPDGDAFVDAPGTSLVVNGLPAQQHSFTVISINDGRYGGFDSAEVSVSGAAPVAPAKGAPVVQAKGGALESGEKATIAGTAPKGQVLQLQQREVTSAGARKTADGFTVLGKTKANKKGTYTFKQKFTRNVEVRVVNLTTGAISPSSFVQVQKDLTLKAKKAGKRTLKLSGKVAPGGAGQVVKVLVKQGAGFVQVGQTTTNKKGAYSFKHTFASKGKAVVQVVSDASSSNTAGSETRTFRVR